MKRTACLAAALLATACASQPAPQDTLTVTDYVRLLEARDQAFAAPTGQQAMWVNVLTGLGGTITPTSEPTVAPDGRACRQLRQVVRAGDGRIDEREIRACLTASGPLTVEGE